MDGGRSVVRLVYDFLIILIDGLEYLEELPEFPQTKLYGNYSTEVHYNVATSNRWPYYNPSTLKV